MVSSQTCGCAFRERVLRVYGGGVLAGVHPGSGSCWRCMCAGSAQQAQFEMIKTNFSCLHVKSLHCYYIAHFCAFAAYI